MLGWVRSGVNAEINEKDEKLGFVDVRCLFWCTKENQMLDMK